MDLVLQSNNFDPKEIRLINYCRMYLQAVTMADLCLADGVSLDPALLSGHPAPTSSVSKWIHINQARPSEPSWRLWRQACSLWSMNNKLHFPLGPWIQPGDKLRRTWPYYYDTQDGDLYIRQPLGYHRCVAIDPIRFSQVSNIKWQPTPTSIPVHARLSIHGDSWLPQLPANIRSVQSNPATIASTFAEYIQTLEEWEKELFADLTMHVDCYDFIQRVETQTQRNTEVQLLTMSDGSDESGKMTFGWIMSLPDGYRLARCSGPAYGPFGTSFRAEGYGFLSVSRFLLRLHKFCNIQPTWRVQLMTDNLGLLTRVEKSLSYPEPFPNITLQPDWDVTHEIVTTLQKMTIKPTLEHVKGHQDDHTLYEELHLNAQLNVDADEEAGYYQSTYPARRPIIPRLPSNRVQLHIAFNFISRTKLSLQNSNRLSVMLSLYLRTKNIYKNEIAGLTSALKQLIGKLILRPSLGSALRESRSQNYVMTYCPPPGGSIDTTNSLPSIVCIVVSLKTAITWFDVPTPLASNGELHCSKLYDKSTTHPRVTRT